MHHPKIKIYAELLLIFFFLLILAPNPASAQTFFTKYVRYGLRGSSEVELIQEFLADEGLYAGPISGNFLIQTLKAIRKFQKREKIKPVTGIWDRKTRKTANKIVAEKFAEEAEEEELEQKSKKKPQPSRPLSYLPAPILPSTTTATTSPIAYISPVQTPLPTASQPSAQTPTTTSPVTQPVSTPTPTPTPTTPIGSGSIGPFPFDTTIYVDSDNASGIEDGSVAKPFNTITEAVNAAQSGARIGVGAGTYRERLTLKSGITIVGYDPATTIIDGGNTKGDIITIISLANVRISGFTIKGAVSGGSLSGGAGIFVNFPQSTITISNNILTGNDFGVGIFNAYLSSGGPVIDRNIIIRNNFAGIQDPGTGAITNNIISYNGTWGIIKGGNSAASQIINNTIVNNTGDGIIIFDDRTAIIKNNIFSVNGGFGVNVTSGNNPTAKRPLVSFNLFYQNSSGNFSDIDSPVGNNATLNTASEINGVSGNSNNIVGDPKLSNPSGGDYRLTNGSAAIDAGTGIEAPPWDFNSRTRAVDGDGNGTAIVDMGADEALAGTSAPRDISAPVISSVQATSIAQTSATITWITNEPSSSDVYFALVSIASATSTTHVIGNIGALSHTVNLTNLRESKTYYYIVVSSDSAGNAATSSEYSFSTLAPQAPPPPPGPGPFSSINGYAQKAVLAGSEYGVIWRITRENSGESEIYFSRVDLNGAKIGSDLLISTGHNTADSNYTIAWNGSEFLAVYEDYWGNVPLHSNSYDSYSTYVSRISAQGQKIGADTKIATGGQLMKMNLLWSGSDYGFIYRNYRPIKLEFRKFDAVGQQVGAAKVIASGSSFDLNEVSAVWTGTEYGAAWNFWEWGAIADAYLSRLSPGGDLINTSLLPRSANQTNNLTLNWDAASGYNVIFR